MPTTRSMAQAAYCPTLSFAAADLARQEQPDQAVFPLLKLPRELRDMVLQYATHETSVHVRKDGEAAKFHLMSPFSGVCHQVEAELKRVKLTPIQWRRANEVTVDVHNLDFDPLVGFLDSLTQQEIDDFKRLGTKVTPLLQFGECPQANKREMEEQTMASLIDWLECSTDPEERWASLSDWTCQWVIKDLNTTVIPWIKALGQFHRDLAMSASGAMMRPQTLGLRRQIAAFVDTGVDAL